MRYAIPRAQSRRMRPILGLAAMLLLLLLTALLLYGCGGSSESGSAGGSGDAPSGSTQGVQDGAGSSTSSTGAATTVGSGRGKQDERDTPQAVKGLYVPGAAASGQRLDRLVKTAEETEVNALVVDVKEAGHTTYPSDVPLAREIGATTNKIPDLKKLVKRLESRGVYTIARLSVFQDDVLPRERPDLAVLDTATGAPWQTYQGGSWANPYRERTWEYNAAIAKEAAEAGFDEIQLDYVRFPSDGPMNRLSYGERPHPRRRPRSRAFWSTHRKSSSRPARSSPPMSLGSSG